MKYEEYTGNGSRPPKKAAELQSDLEAIRAEMSETLSQIEERFSAREIVDELFHRARQAGRGGSEFLTNLGESVRDNPIPILLIGGGVTALLISEHRGASEEGDTESRTEELKGKTGEAKKRAGKAKKRAGEAKERVTGRASELREQLSSTTGRARERGRRVVEEQPLVLAGLGVALGALLGAGTPMSEREHRILGPKRDELKEEAKETKERVRKTSESHPET